MSINVTVTGNPISIKRGRMVTSDSYQTKKEFEKRRLMRLEQVRQQSKDLAEDIRNKVRREKKKQLRQIKEEGQEKLKSWQNKKLHELQSQYEGALEELGTGHKQAVILEDESDILNEQKKHNDKVAVFRGQVAATKLQVDKNKESLKKAIPLQQKKLVRDVENIRASLVSGIQKNKTSGTKDDKSKKKKTVPEFSLRIPCSDCESSEEEPINIDNNLESDVPSVVDGEKCSPNSCDCTDVSSDIPREPLNFDKNRQATDKETKSPPKSPRHRREVGGINLAKQISDRRKVIEEYRQRSSNVSPPVDTRISDRIKRRELMASQLDYCDTVAKTHPTPFIESNTQLRDAVDARKINCVCGHKCPEMCGNKFKDNSEIYEDEEEYNKNRPEKNKQKITLKSKEITSDTDIPERPPIKLIDKHGQTKTTSGPSKDTLETYDSHKVNYYDHPNRFSQDRQVPSTSHVEKITADSLEVIPNLASEKEWEEKMKQRDREAIIRGKKAMEKERIQKEYEEILRKLPLLQKKERICEIAKDKQEYHMSDDRLKERDRKKQNELDNAYTKLFPNLKPAIVTLPSKKEDKHVTLAADEPIQSLNVGNWDVDHEEQKMFTVDEVQEIVKAFTEQKPKDRRAKLKQLLKSLKLQKEQLINEIKSLPANDSINELIGDLNSFSDGDDKSASKNGKKDKKSERKRKRIDIEKGTPTDSTTESTSTSSSKTGKHRKSRDKHKLHHSSIKTPSPRKRVKIKSKRRVLILQNMSTQTTPKTNDKIEQAEIKTTNEIEEKEKPICPKLHVPCDCNKENESTDELCQILIKINDKDEPEVVVKSKEKRVKKLPTEELSKVKERSPKRHKKTECKSIGVGTDELKIATKDEKVIDSRVPSSASQKSNVDTSKNVSVQKSKPDLKIDKVDSKKSKASQDTSSKSKSWKEHLSKNSVSTSSTSYFSPPNFYKPEDSQNLSSITKESKQSLYNLRKKPQQGNIQNASSAFSVSPPQSSLEHQTVDPRLLAYVKKLLSMSRGSIENLTVSSSSVQTPSQSVIEMESNNPLGLLPDLIKYFNSKVVSSPDYSPIHYNTTDSNTEVSQPQRIQDNLDFVTDHGSKNGNTDQSSKSAVDKETSSCSAKSKDSVLAQYADITDSCSRRIAQLASMIEQIREEKIQMLQNPIPSEGTEKLGTTDKDLSTAYMELPGSTESSGKYSSINSLDDEELQRRLLEIDFSLAEKLRKFPSKKPDADSINKKRPVSPEDPIDEGNNTNAELWSRLKRLTEQEAQNGRKTQAAIDQISNNLPFVPFLSDIPILPKFEDQPENSKLKADTSLSLHKRPPPSKGLSVAKKFNGNISLVPHELSTIAEADSQLSTKIGSANNSKTSQDVSPRKAFELIVQPDVEIVLDKTLASKDLSKSDKSSPSHITKICLTKKHDCYDTCTNICSKVAPTGTTPPSSVVNISEGSSQSIVLACSKSTQLSSSSDDMESIETMLRSIGMEWAIPTLHKTKEALALTSSSSSIELGSKRQGKSNDSSKSEVSLKQFLKAVKMSSSTLRSDVTPVSFSGDLSELSSIQVNNSNGERTNQRTSTPVISTKSADKSRKSVMFSADSDISSVKEDTQKHSSKSSKTSYRSFSDNSPS